MRAAIDSGMAKLKIEEAAAHKQAKIDSGHDIIVGVNKYRLQKEETVNVLAIDNKEVREKQIQR
ncbi:methylmalonyl-CoA mutase, large subunit [Reticulomyxa filosa]|uniref:Methylmalonyl-CoA mutase, large subunit n=1 Tax=Reticulomyxa filosa TaxID=46433 RepID=X6N1U3_RETFI|nr:methylmalonyl-CoA mutase, large subunit [Reticulomyxa filosa]|eukprot:ETO20036.1 methylmalonyl-CoA mutase, large subunit [Reticulomyxa filosa]